MKKLFFFLSIVLSTGVLAQSVGINSTGASPDNSAMLDVKSTSKGMLVPRMTSNQRTNISNPADGLLVYDTETQSFWYRSNTGWIDLNKKSIADEDNDTHIEVEQSEDEDIIRFRAGGKEILTLQRKGSDDYLIEPGVLNTMYGNGAGENNLALQNGQGLSNTFIGVRAGRDNSEGAENTVLGHDAGQELDAGSKNVYIGKEAGRSNVNGNSNVFIGYNAGSNEGSSNRLFIDNSNTEHPLLYGEFDNDLLRINGTLESRGKTSSNRLLINPSNTSQGGDASIFLSEDHDGTYGMYWEYDGGLNKMRLFGKSEDDVFGPHLSINRNDGLIEIANAYTLPLVDGNANQVLSTDGAGNASWSDAPGSKWQDGPDDAVFYTNGSVGIGTTVPNFPLSAYSNFSTARISSIGLSSANKIALDISCVNSSFVTAPDSIIGIRTTAGGSTGTNIALLSEVNNNVDLAAKFDGKVELANSNSTSNQVLISPSNASFNGSSSLFFAEDNDGTYGMYWEYNGGINKMRLFGWDDGEINGPHLSVNRDDGVIEFGDNDFIFNPDVNGDSRFTTDELQIRGGSDLSEYFDINSEAKPGMIVAIDPTSEGGLQLSSEANSKLVVGVISGANGIETGMMMGQVGSIADGDTPVALAGRVYVRVNTENGLIQPGDFITSSSIPGEGMRVKNIPQSQGAIIGKAMTYPDSNGFVLVLVNLQ
ncbi:MAG: hypothetical protein AAGA77_07440 [Bacteroidota bacterium]